MIFKPLTERLELQELTYTGNSYNKMEVWTTFRVIYGSITGEKGDMKYNNGYAYSDSISFYLRYTPVVSKKGIRIFYKGAKYTINNITNTPRNANTIIDCEAVI